MNLDVGMTSSTLHDAITDNFLVPHHQVVEYGLQTIHLLAEARSAGKTTYMDSQWGTLVPPYLSLDAIDLRIVCFPFQNEVSEFSWLVGFGLAEGHFLMRRRWV